MKGSTISEFQTCVLTCFSTSYFLPFYTGSTGQFLCPCLSLNIGPLHWVCGKGPMSSAGLHRSIRAVTLLSLRGPFQDLLETFGDGWALLQKIRFTQAFLHCIQARWRSTYSIPSVPVHRPSWCIELAIMMVSCFSVFRSPWVSPRTRALVALLVTLRYGRVIAWMVVQGASCRLYT